MPAKSVKQFRFMKGVESGSIDAPGLSPSAAAEFVKGQSPKALPMIKPPVGMPTTAVSAPIPSQPSPAGRTPIMPGTSDHQRIAHHMMVGNGVHSSGRGKR